MAKKPVSNVTSLDYLRSMGNGIIIEVQGFEPETPLQIRVRRPDMATVMIKSKLDWAGLSKSVKKAFGEVPMEDGENATPEQLEDRMKSINEAMPMIDTLCKEAMLEPTYDDFEEIMPLGVTQKIQIFKWVMQEARELNSFRIG
jgi:hypothetical protein